MNGVDKMALALGIGDVFHQHWRLFQCLHEYRGLWRQPVLTTLRQSSCFSRITSFLPTVNLPLQMRCCHCAAVLQSLLAVLWFWSRCPPPPFWCRLQFYSSLKAPYVLGAALLGSLAPSQRKLCCFWFLHLPETACIPWVVAPSSNF